MEMWKTEPHLTTPELTWLWQWIAVSKNVFPQSTHWNKLHLRLLLLLHLHFFSCFLISAQLHLRSRKMIFWAVNFHKVIKLIEHIKHAYVPTFVSSITYWIIISYLNIIPKSKSIIDFVPLRSNISVCFLNVFIWVTLCWHTLTHIW